MEIDGENGPRVLADLVLGHDADEGGVAALPEEAYAQITYALMQDEESAADAVQQFQDACMQQAGELRCNGKRARHWALAWVRVGLGSAFGALIPSCHSHV
jgi:hypothetical protein